MTVTKIVSHPDPRHLDDFLALSLLSSLYQAQIEYVHPQKVPQEYLQDPHVILVDVGGSYDPGKNNYDHHQNKDLPCSLSLVIKHFFPDIGESSALTAIDVMDRLGFQEAVKLGLARVDEEVDEMRKIILLVKPSPEVGFTAKRLLEYAASARLNYENFIKMLYESLRVQGLTREAEEKIKEEKRIFEDKLSRVEYVRTNKSFLVAISHESLAPYHGEFFKRTGVDLLVEANSMKPELHTSIIANTSKPDKDDLIKLADEIAKDYEVIFRHNTGFIRVLNVNSKDFAMEFKAKFLPKERMIRR